ncbi:hypothetical protein EVAR_94672_1 [Eumeta japonica]|uniref:Uncharacterized protein n=1 Tax=Eumeta variegata TaxID=151549 RepID=A0A4C1SCQ2_EUMVA|nr:hypothetical protein EVAR_94672_1 [Eumeta japonica]
MGKIVELSTKERPTYANKYVLNLQNASAYLSHFQHSPTFKGDAIRRFALTQARARNHSHTDLARTWPRDSEIIQHLTLLTLILITSDADYVAIPIMDNREGRYIVIITKQSAMFLEVSKYPSRRRPRWRIRIPNFTISHPSDGAGAGPVCSE